MFEDFSLKVKGGSQKHYNIAKDTSIPRRM